MCKSKQKPNENILAKKETHNVDIFVIELNGNGPITETVKINNTSCQFQVDTGAAISILSKHQWEMI